jgi:hypothetical protein
MTEGAYATEGIGWGGVWLRCGGGAGERQRTPRERPARGGEAASVWANGEAVSQGASGPRNPRGPTERKRGEG